MSAPSETGRWTRLAFGLQVLAALALAVGACALVIHLSEWRRVRWRSDFTSSGRNTLDPQTLALLKKIDQPVTVDVFFREASTEHMLAVTSEAQGRMLELLHAAKFSLPEKLRIEEHDLRDLTDAKSRMDELDLEEVQSVVVSLDDRREVLRLYSDIANIDYGNPDRRQPQPAMLHLFRGEEAFAEALKKVSAGDTPRVYFSIGHGEVDPLGTESRDLGSLSSELRRQGFEIGTWEGAESGPVPADCDVLAVIGPVQPFSDLEREYLRSWVAGGGRLFGATESRFSEEAGSVTQMLRSYGMLLTRGMVCMPVLDYFGNQTEGLPECTDFRVSEREMNARHPITESLVERKRKLRFVFARSFDFGAPPEGGLLLDLASSPAESWRDLPDDKLALNFALDSARESTGRFRLAMAATFPVSGAEVSSDESGADSNPTGPHREGRVVGVSSPFLLANNTFGTNRDFLLNAFNWLAERDFRVGVSSRDPERRLLDISRGTNLSIVFHSTLWGLPCVFGVLGIVTFLRRRR